MIILLANYEDTIGAIKSAQWQRERVREDGPFLENNTGHLLITCAPNANIQDLLRTTYVSFIRFKNNKKDEWCSSVSSILTKKFYPMTNEEILQKVVNGLIINIPLPIMLTKKDLLFFFRPIDGKPKGKTFRVIETFN